MDIKTLQSISIYIQFLSTKAENVLVQWKFNLLFLVQSTRPGIPNQDLCHMTLFGLQDFPR